MSAQVPTNSSLFDRVATEVAAPFLLDDAGTSWFVKQGRVDVFSIPVGTGISGGPRRFLFSADPGEVILGMADVRHAVYPLSFLAVPLRGTALASFDSHEFSAQGAQDEVRHAGLAWVQDISGAIGRAASAGAAPRIHLGLRAGEAGRLTAGQRAACPRGDFLWVEVLEGRVSVCGDEALVLDPTSSKFPLPPGLWVTGLDDAELTASHGDDTIDASTLSAGIDRLREYFGRWAAATAAAQDAAEREHQTAKEALDRRARESGILSLGSVLGKIDVGEAPRAAPGEELLVAMRMAGAPDGLTFVPAPEWERTAKRNDPLQAICRASKVRCRQIRLQGHWWDRDAGHLLAFQKGEDRHPVALLWCRTHYEMHSPAGGAPRVIDEAMAQNLEQLGFMFYAPFPEKPLGPKDLLGIAYDTVRTEVWSLGAIGLATAMIGLLVPWATDKMLSDIIPIAASSAALVLVLALIAVQIGGALFDGAKAFVLVRMEGRSSAYLQAGLVDRLLSLPARFYRDFTVGDLANRASGINAVRDLLSGAAATSLMAGIFATVYLVQLWWYSWRLSLVALGVMALAMGVAAVVVRRSLRWQRIQQDLAGQLSGFTVELIGSIPKLRVAAAEERAFAQWSTRFRRQKDASLAAGYNDVALQVFTTVLPLLASLALFGYAGWMTTQGKEYALDPGKFIAFNTAFGTFFVAIVNVVNTMITVLVAIPMLERAAPILTARPELSVERSDPGELSGAIQVSHLSFRYKADGPLILDDVSFTASPGEFVAFVGPSGSGKSTTLRMLLGFEQPETGAIYYDQQDLDTLDLSAVRTQIGVVLQSSRLSQGDIYQNIVGSAPLSLDDAWAAAEAAGLAKDIEEMPMQMHTVVSEGGSTLSGGQRQRLMIARALVRVPRIIFFDEATSALDNRTQEQVSESLARTNATRIVIAHRLSTIRHADRIYVMDQGRVIQAGTFSELSEVPGMFRDLVVRQMA